MMNKRLIIMLIAVILGVAAFGAGLIFLTVELFSGSSGLILLINAIIVLLIGAAVLAGTVFTYVYVKEEGRGCTLPVQAVVSEITETRTRLGNSHQDSIIYMAKYAYELDGRTRIVASHMGSYSKKHFRIGDRTEILINPDDPTRCYVEKETREKLRVLHCIWIPLMAAGVILYAVGVFI